MTLLTRFLLALVIVVCAGCDRAVEQPAAEDTVEMPPPAVADVVEPEFDGVCENPRPQVCTMEYRPVCGFSDSASKTYSNACSACSEIAVIAYNEGECPGDQPDQ